MTFAMLSSEGIINIRFRRTSSIMFRSPRAPVFRLMASLATARMVSSSMTSSTSSNANMALYCLKREFFGSFSTCTS